MCVFVVFFCLVSIFCLFSFVRNLHMLEACSVLCWTCCGVVRSSRRWMQSHGATACRCYLRSRPQRKRGTNSTHSARKDLSRSSTSYHQEFAPSVGAYTHCACGYSISLTEERRWLLGPTTVVWAYLQDSFGAIFSNCQSGERPLCTDDTQKPRCSVKTNSCVGRRRCWM